MFNFKYEATDKVYSAVVSAYREALLEGTVDLTSRPMPIVSITDIDDVEEVTVDGDIEEIPVVSTTSYVETMKDDHTPYVLELDEKSIDKLSVEAVTSLVKELLNLGADTISATSIEEDGGTQIHTTLDDLGIDKTILSSKHKIITQDGEDEEDVKSSCAHKTLDLSRLTTTIEEAEATPVSGDYKVKHEKIAKTSILPEKVNRYLDSSTTKEDIESRSSRVAKVESVLAHAIKAKGLTPRARIVPSKRLHTRNMVLDLDNQYRGNVADKGTDINIVLLLDRSGSMSGHPAIESAIMVSALNNLAYDNPKLKCSVILSDCGGKSTIDLPTTTKDDIGLLRLTDTHGAEGLEDNMKKESKRIEEADVVFTYTDGHIAGANIDKPYYSMRGIQLVGLYVVSGELTPEVYTKHYSTNKTWFHEVVIANTVEGLVENMARYLVQK